MLTASPRDVEEVCSMIVDFFQNPVDFFHILWIFFRNPEKNPHSLQTANSRNLGSNPLIWTYVGRTDADALPALVRYQCRAFLVTVVYTTVTVRRFAPPRLARFCQPLPCSHSHKTTTRKAFLMIIFLKFIYFVVVFRWNHGNRASSKRNYKKIKIYLFFTLIQRISLIPKLDFQIY